MRIEFKDETYRESVSIFIGQIIDMFGYEVELVLDTDDNGIAIIKFIEPELRYWGTGDRVSSLVLVNKEDSNDKTSLEHVKLYHECKKELERYRRVGYIPDKERY